MGANYSQHHAAYWVPDSSRKSCTSCRTPFSFPFVRRHHCRSCGQIFCDACTQERIAVPQRRYNSAVRTCRICFLTLKAFISQQRPRPDMRTDENSISIVPSAPGRSSVLPALDQSSSLIAEDCDFSPKSNIAAVASRFTPSCFEREDFAVTDLALPQQPRIHSDGDDDDEDRQLPVTTAASAKGTAKEGGSDEDDAINKEEEEYASSLHSQHRLPEITIGIEAATPEAASSVASSLQESWPMAVSALSVLGDISLHRGIQNNKSFLSPKAGSEFSPRSQVNVEILISSGNEREDFGFVVDFELLNDADPPALIEKTKSLTVANQIDDSVTMTQSQLECGVAEAKGVNDLLNTDGSGMDLSGGVLVAPDASRSRKRLGDNAAQPNDSTADVLSDPLNLGHLGDDFGRLWGNRRAAVEQNEVLRTTTMLPKVSKALMDKAKEAPVDEQPSFLIMAFDVFEVPAPESMPPPKALWSSSIFQRSLTATTNEAESFLFACVPASVQKWWTWALRNEAFLDQMENLLAINAPAVTGSVVYVCFHRGHVTVKADGANVHDWLCALDQSRSSM